MTPRGEFEWIDRLAEILGDAGIDARGHPAIGDDTAFLPAGGPWAWTVDTLVEDVHFRFDWLEPAAVGHRALAASLSDLAAAGAKPVGALVSAAGPAATFDARLEGIYEGTAALARRAGCPVLGGDLARAEGPLHLTVTAIGTAIGEAPLARHGARPGDRVWVTGRLGAPSAAVRLARAAEGDPAALERARAGAAWPRFAFPEPRVREMAWLLERARPTAAIDLSDGLSGDALHVADRSGVRIVLDADRLPIHPGVAGIAGPAPAAGAVPADGPPPADHPLERALHGGEEFEVLLTAPAGSLEPWAEPFEAAFGIPLTPIGEVAGGSGVALRRDGREAPLEPRSWDHFAGRDGG